MIPNDTMDLMIDRQEECLAAIYPGSFDPITLGHIDIIGRAIQVFDKLIVLVSQARDKKYLFSQGERVALIKKSLLEKNVSLARIEVEFTNDLTVNYARSKKARVLIRGLRSASDLEYEYIMAHMNQNLEPNIETMLVFAGHQYRMVSSTMIKEIAYHGGDLTPYLSLSVAQELKVRLQNQ